MSVRRRVREILFVHDIEPLALLLGVLTLIYGLFLLLDLAQPTTLTLSLSTETVGIVMTVAGVIKLVGLTVTGYRTHLLGTALGVICWIFLAATVWMLSGRTLATLQYAWIAFCSFGVGCRLYWDHVRLTTDGATHAEA